MLTRYKFSDFIFIFPIGAAGYSLLEVLWRGYTHWSMAITGGLCFCIIYQISCKLPAKRLVQQTFHCAFAVTGIEFAAGCILNLLFKMDVWDYSDLPFHLLGQICLPYFFLWALLCFPLHFLCTALSRWIRRLERVSADNCI